jgi:hypothetical protein
MSHSFSTILKTLGVPTLVARASALGVFLLEVGVNPMDRLDPNGGVVLLARKRVGEELACLNCMRSSSTASQTWMSLMSKSP